MKRVILGLSITAIAALGLLAVVALVPAGPPIQPAPGPMEGLVGKVVWVNSIDFDGRYPNPASWGYHLKDNLTDFPTAYPCEVLAVDVGQDGPEQGSVRCRIGGGSGFDGDYGWTSDFHRTPHPSF